MHIMLHPQPSITPRTRAYLRNTEATNVAPGPRERGHPQPYRGVVEKTTRTSRMRLKLVVTRN